MLKLLVIAVVLLFTAGVLAQDPKIISRIENSARLARAWNSIAPATRQYNAAMQQIDKSFHITPPGRVLDEAERKKRVGWEKEARSALLTELDGVNELLNEEDFEADNK